jgi:hypothetical protein
VPTEDPTGVETEDSEVLNPQTRGLGFSSGSRYLRQVAAKDSEVLDIIVMYQHA